MLFAVRKDYSEVKGNLGKIKAAVADIGWFLTQQLYAQSMSREVTQLLKINDFKSGQKFLEHFLEDAGNKSWFNDIEQRAAHYSSSVGSVRSALTELCRSNVLFEQEGNHLKHRDRCIEVSLLCEYLEEHIRKEIEETKQPLLRLL